MISSHSGKNVIARSRAPALERTGRRLLPPELSRLEPRNNAPHSSPRAEDDISDTSNRNPRNHYRSGFRGVASVAASGSTAADVAAGQYTCVLGGVDERSRLEEPFADVKGDADSRTSGTPVFSPAGIR